MAAKEIAKPITTADNSVRMAIDGPHRVDLIGDFGGGTLTHYSFTDESGRGASVHADSTVNDAYESHTPQSEFELLGSTSADLKVILTPIIQVVSS